MSETLSIPNFKTISYSNPVFSIEFDTLDVTLEMDENGYSLTNSLSSAQIDPFEGKNLPIQFQWGNETLSAKIFCVEKVYSLNGSSIPETHIIFRLIDIKGVSDFTTFEHVWFYIPHIHFIHKQPANNIGTGWSVCKSEIVFNSKKWVFMNAYDIGQHYPVPYERTYNGNPLCGTLISTERTLHQDFNEIRLQVFYLCTILGFAVGKLNMWQSAWGTNGNGIHFIATSGYECTPSNRNKAIIYYGDSTHRSSIHPIKFVEDVSEEFSKDSEWWQITLNWIINENINPTIENSKLIEFMMLDRLSHKIYSTIVRIALKMDLDKYESNASIKKHISSNLINKIKKHKSKAQSIEEKEFMQMCNHWASHPCYTSKISSISSFAGYALSGKEIHNLKMRHKLVHQGRLDKIPSTVIQYATETTSFCRALVLAVIGFDGYFAAYSAKPAVTEVFQQANRLKFSNIEKLATKLLAGN